MKLKIVLLALTALVSPHGHTQHQNLSVCVSEVPPFVIQEGSQWSGLDIDIWDQIARDNQWTYSYQSRNLQDLTAALTSGECDIFIRRAHHDSKKRRNN